MVYEKYIQLKSVLTGCVRNFIVSQSLVRHVAHCDGEFAHCSVVLSAAVEAILHISDFTLDCLPVSCRVVRESVCGCVGVNVGVGVGVGMRVGVSERCIE
jgi:hypothetical protein